MGKIDPFMMSLISMGIKLGGSALSNLFSGSSGNMPNPQQMSYFQAATQARQMLEPGYKRQLEGTLKKVDTDARNRGFFGQAPAEAVRRSTASDLASGHEGQVANLAYNIQQGDLQNQLSLAQLAMQQAGQKGQGWQAVGNLIGSALPYAYDAWQSRPLDDTLKKFTNSGMNQAWTGGYGYLGGAGGAMNRLRPPYTFPY